MGGIMERFNDVGPILLDGAWGTQLQARGLPIGACPDAWNLLHPDLVREVARAYVDAGSQVILTNTFGASRIGLSRHGLGDKMVEINRIGAEISRAAADDRALVFASMGPTGAMLAMEDITEDEVRTAFEQQAEALADGGADAIVVETMIDLREAKIAVEAALGTGLPVVACMVFDSGKEGDRTMMGVTPEKAAAELGSMGVSAIGSNCGRGAAQMLPICRRLRNATSLPLWIKPNAGMPELVDGKAVYRTTPVEFSSAAEELVKAGAYFIGGCCGTSPEFIRALSHTLKILI